MTDVCSEPGCDRPLAKNPRRKGTRCQRCAASAMSKSPEKRAKCAETMRARFEDPAYRELHRKRTAEGQRRAMAENPALVELRREQGRRVGKVWGGAGGPPGSESRQKAARKQSEFYMGWCPIEYRPEYRRLIRNVGIRAAAARRMIEEQIELDLGKYARTGVLPVSGGKS